MTAALQPVRLINGAEEPAALVAIIMMSLKRIFEEANGTDPMKAMSAILSLYDLKMLCLGQDPAYTDECRGCFGNNRKRLLDLSLVEGEETGPLRVNRQIRNIVDSALNVDMSTFSVTLDDPVDRDGLHPPGGSLE